MESQVSDAAAGQAEQTAGEGQANSGAAPGPAGSASLGAARWKLLRQVRESPLNSLLPLATPLASDLQLLYPWKLGEFPQNFTGSRLRSAPLVHLRVPPKREASGGIGREGAAKAESWETPIEVEDSFLDISLHLRDFSSCPPVGLVEPPLRSPYCSFMLLFYFLPLISSPFFLTPVSSPKSGPSFGDQRG